MRECQNQVKDQAPENKLFYCLVFKEYYSECPSSCSYQAEGSSIPMDLIYQNEYEMECLFFQLLVQLTPHDEGTFVCTLLGKIDNQLPECKFCPLKGQLINNDLNHVET